MSACMRRASTRTVAVISTKHASIGTFSRYFSEVAKNDEAMNAAAAEETLMTKLREQQLAKAERTSAFCIALAPFSLTLIIRSI